MTELSVVPNDSTDSAAVDDSAETNDMPKVVDTAKLPTVPETIPAPILDYAKTSARGRVQVNHITKYHAELLEHGKNLLSQHHAEGAAEIQLDTADEFADKRAELDALDAEAEKARVEWEKLQDDADNAREAAIAEIVAQSHSDLDFEVEELEYTTALQNLNNQVKMLEAAGESVQNVLRQFVKNVPTAKNLVEGKRKGTRSTLPGQNNGSEGWKPRFEWLEVNGEIVPSVNTIGQLAKVLDNGKSYDKILGTLTNKFPGRSIADDTIAEWQYSIQNLDDGSETVMKFRGLALSRATKNARLNDAAKSNGSPEGNESSEAAASVPEVQGSEESGDNSGDSAAVDY